MKLYIYILIIFSLPILTGCVDEIPLKSTFERELFISGDLINANLPVTLNIQETVPVNNANFKPISNAGVTLYEKEPAGKVSIIANSFSVDKGVYTSYDSITTSIGNSYWVEIDLQDGTKYRSDEELLKEPVPVEDITKTEFATRVLFSDPADDINYYLIRFVFYQNDEILDDSWIITNDVAFNGNEDAFIERDFLDGNRVFVSLQNINVNTYQFYLNLESQLTNPEEDPNESSSSIDPTQLFLPLPANLIGNITNISKNKRALGYFGVSGYDDAVKDF